MRKCYGGCVYMCTCMVGLAWGERERETPSGRVGRGGGGGGEEEKE